eukprot:TRINITY_DN2573_c0_g2_i1.p1 TRINITY_DN2573_c0_g2~~TRINITY_DN2573_c0_g2_i1.p1  ORF type:complete len:3323 (+),score=759.25 TRINITY_DN2573_c0_g2_i1:349-9969(+)
MDGKPDYSSRVILSTQFTVDEEYAISASLEFEFAVGALEMSIRDIDVDTPSDFEGTSVSGGQMLKGFIMPGTYKLTIKTGVTQPLAQLKNARLDAMPACLAFKLDWHMGRPHNSGHTKCVPVPIPSSLNSPAYLLTTHHADIVERWSVPDFVGTDGSTIMVDSETLFIEPEVDSLFRVVIDRTALLDVDIFLYEDSTLVANGTSGYTDSSMLGGGYGEEKIVYPLIAHESYKLEFVFYNLDFSGSGHTIDTTCGQVSVELAVAPAATHDTGSHCSGDRRYTPPSDLIPAVRTADASWHSEDVYTYKQSSHKTLQSEIKFDTDYPVWFVANVEYDFLFSDLSLQLLKSDNTTLAWGTNGRNFNQLGPFLVEPGQYHLQVYEPVPSVKSQLSCVNFTLFVGYGSTQDNVPEALDSALGCGSKAFDLPLTFNSPGYLTDATTNMMHFQRDILADIGIGYEGTDFHLAENGGSWYLRLYVPPSESFDRTLDVDFYLYNGTAATYNTKDTIAYGVTTLEEESIFVRLAPGDYFLYTKVYDWSVPDAADDDEQTLLQGKCRYFPLEIVLSEASIPEAIEWISTKCEEPVLLPPTIAMSNAYHKISLAMDRHGSTANFVTTEFTDAYFEVDSDFLTGHLTMYLESDTEPTIFPQVGYDVSFIDATLAPANYTLVLEATKPRPSHLIGCYPSAFKYRVKPYFLPSDGSEPDEESYSTSEVPTDDSCPELNHLPRNLHKTNGGSVPYGGPQADDGSIRMWATDILAPGDVTDRYIKFLVPTDSYVRVFLYGVDVDYDFRLYSNDTDLANSLIGSSFGAPPVENALWRVDGQEGPLVLNLHLFQLLNSEDCLYYSIEIAIRPVEVLIEELSCPVPMPSPHLPRKTRNIKADAHIRSYHENYVFTKDDLESSSFWYMTYNMALNITTPTTISTYIAYEFLANDFLLVLQDSNGNGIANGGPSGAGSHDEYLDFENHLEVMVDPGMYTLVIQQFNLDANPIDFDDYCYRFAFSFIADSEPASSEPEEAPTPYLTHIDPPSGDHLNPDSELEVTLYFSEKVHKPPVISADHRVVALRYNPAVFDLLPSSQVWNSDQTSLTLSWSPPFFAGMSYHLEVDPSAFVTSSKTPDRQQFQFEVTPADSDYWYTMEASCECGAHGECVDGACACDDGYALPLCDACTAGYVPIGDVCQRRVQCTSTQCHDNGMCDDATGVAVCECDDPFAGDRCQSCAAGYAGYPSCAPTGESQDKSVDCHVALFPATLDDPAYLGNDGTTHFQGDYYLDLDHMSHETVFTLNHDSLFRVYSEPHWVDIDIWLYEVDSQGSVVKTIFYLRNVNDEETAYVKIPGSSSSPRFYKIRFNYYLWGDYARKEDTDCVTANIEVAIAPQSSVGVGADVDTVVMMTQACKDGKLPFDDITSTPDKPMLIDPSGFTYGSPTTGHDVATTYAVSSGASSAFLRFPFTTAAVAGSDVRITVDLTYRFLLGDMAVLLQTDHGDHTCVNASSSSVFPSKHSDQALSCEPGRNYLNGHLLDIIVPSGGNYTIWLYQPAPQMGDINSCAVFNFRTVVQYVIQKDDQFSCNMPRLPETFNLPGYLGYTQTDAPMHLSGPFHVDDIIIPFTLTRESLFRVSATSEENWISLFLDDGDDNSISWQGAGSNTPTAIVTRLPPGSYTLEVWGHDVALVETACQTTTIELAIVPSTVAGATLSCADGPKALPNIPNNIRGAFSLGTSPAARASPFNYVAVRPPPSDYPSSSSYDHEPWIEEEGEDEEGVSSDQMEHLQPQPKDKRGGAPSTPRSGKAAVHKEVMERLRAVPAHQRQELDVKEIIREVLSQSSNDLDGFLRRDPLAREEREVEDSSSDDFSYDPFGAEMMYDDYVSLAKYPITVHKLAYVNAEVLSSFINADISLAISPADHSWDIIYGVSDFNRNYINTILSPGNYTLYLYAVNPTYALHTPVALPECIPFNFALDVRAFSGKNVTNSCQFFGEEVPSTLNSHRYLADESAFVYESGQFRVTSDQCMLDNNVHTITFTVQRASVLRFFVEEHAVDVDIYLYGRAFGSTEAPHLLYNSQNSFGDETLLAPVGPGIEYTIELIYFCWGFQPNPVMTKCFYIDMEFGIEPETALPSICDTEDVWPPHLPKKSLPDTPYYYDSQLEGYDNLHFQQRSGEKQSKSYPFSLTESSNVRFEVSYDFVKADLLLELSAAKSKHDSDNVVLYVGNNWQDRNVIVVEGLAAGDYSLTIREASPPLGAILGCACFGYSVAIESAVLSLREMLTEYNPLPVSLNTINQLNYDGSARMAGVYDLVDWNSELDFWNVWNAIVIGDLKKDSLLRVTFSFPEQADGLWDWWLPEVRLLKCNADSGTYCGDAQATALSTTGTSANLWELDSDSTYQLMFDQAYLSAYWGSNDPTYINLALDSIDSLKDHIKQNGEDDASCTDSVIPPITPNAAGAFAYHSSTLQLSAATRQTKLVFTSDNSLDFKLDVTSSVYVSVGSEFLLDEMWVTLRNKGDPIDIKTALRGQQTGNEIQMTEVLEAGEYSLALGQYELFNKSLGLDHCTTYSLTVYIRLPTASAAQTPCVTQYTLPYDLFTLVGGSGAYGGPINATTGALDFYGNQFLQPDPSEVGDRAVEVIKITAPADGMLVIYTNPSDGTNAIIPSLLCTNAPCPGGAQPELVLNWKANGDGDSRASVYKLAAHQDLSIELEFDDLERASRLNLLCPHYEMYMSLRSDAAIAAVAGDCSDWDPQALVVDDDGFGGLADTYTMPDSFRGSAWDRPFTLVNRSYVDVSLSFDPLVAFFDIDVIADDSSVNVYYDSTLQAAPNVASGLVANLHASLSPGSYFLRFKPLFVTPADSDSCAPFDLAVSVAPKGGKPYVADINPSSAEALSLDWDFLVRLELSTGAYDKEGVRVNLANSDVVTGAFTLQPTAGSGAAAVQAKTAMSDSVGVYWTLLFPRDKLTQDSSYTLSLTKGVLFNKKGTEFVLPSSFLGVYTTSSVDCNEHGDLNTKTGECECYPGYGGQQCGRCARSYHRDGSVCVPDVTEQCEALSCSNNGDCDDSTGAVVCSCDDGYAPPTCGVCADGYYRSGGACVMRSTDDTSESEATESETSTHPTTVGSPTTAGTGIGTPSTHEPTTATSEGTNIDGEPRGWPEVLDNIKIAGMIFGAIVICVVFTIGGVAYMRGKKGSAGHTYSSIAQGMEMDNNFASAGGWDDDNDNF